MAILRGYCDLTHMQALWDLGEGSTRWEVIVGARVGVGIEMCPCRAWADVRVVERLVIG